MSSSVKQLILPIKLSQHASFETFYAERNSQLHHFLQQDLFNEKNSLCLIWGGKNAGKSHLLQACCQRADEMGLTSGYIPLQDIILHPPLLLQGLENADLLCIDDVDSIAGNTVWEEALFHFYNKARARASRLVFTSSITPQRFEFGLADLASRLSACMTFALQPLNEDEKKQAFKLAVKQRGLSLQTSVIEYIFRYYERDMSVLMELLQRLDEACWETRHKITLPFVKHILNASIS